MTRDEEQKLLAMRRVTAMETIAAELTKIRETLELCIDPIAQRFRIDTSESDE